MVKRTHSASPEGSAADSSGSEFEEVIIHQGQGSSSSARLVPPTPGGSSDEEEAWDEVDVDRDERASTIAQITAVRTAAEAAASLGGGEIEIVIKGNGKGKGKGAVKAKRPGTTMEDRMIRQQTHKTHAMAQLASGLIRNRWLNDDLLKARLLSGVPLNILNAFSTFNKTTHPNERDRSRMFDHALKDLLSWWWQTFDVEEGKGIRRRLPSDVDEELVALGLIPPEAIFVPEVKEKGKGKETAASLKAAKRKQLLAGKTFDQTTKGLGDYARSVNTLEKAAIHKRGSADMSAQLFVALCRAMNIPARLIFSLQPYDWRAPSSLAQGRAPRLQKVDTDGKTSDEEGTPKATQTRGRKGKVSSAKKSTRKQELAADSTAESDSSWADGRGEMEYAIPAVNLRKTKVPRKDLTRSPSPDADVMSKPPVYWVEVWSRPNRSWIPVDVYRKKMRCKGIMEPPKSMVENQMVYVCAYEEDSTIRDVTPRYAKGYNVSTVKSRVPSKKGTDWFAELIKPYARDFLLNRDRDEEEELWSRKAHEPMPTSVAGFKNHPTYFLEQHLKRDEAILPDSKQLGHFRGTEIVYSASSIVNVKSVENYYRVGYVVREDEVPIKWVKKRSVTINKKREEAAAIYDGQQEAMEGLYADSQTEIYVPPPIFDGKVPRNDFGNIDLFVPSMLPAGAVHLPYKSAAKSAKSLGIDYADAITGFEFRQRRANPVIAGIVVAEEYGELLMEAISNMDEAALEKETEKLREKCLKGWKKLVAGLRIRQRIQATYNAGTDVVTTEGASQFSTTVPVPSTAPKKPKKIAAAKPSKLRKVKLPSESPSPPPPPPPKLNRSSSGRSLKLTVKPVELPESLIEPKVKDEDSEVLAMEVDQDGDSDSEIEYLSDF